MQQILVNLDGRTRETALERARKALQEAAGARISLLSPRATRTIPTRAATAATSATTPPLRSSSRYARRIAAKTKGEISGPVEIAIRLPHRQVRRPQALGADQVRGGRQGGSSRPSGSASRSSASRTSSREVRSSPSVVVHRDNVEKLVVPVDPAMVQRALERSRRVEVTRCDLARHRRPVTMNTVRVFIGYDSREVVAYSVLAHSIHARASQPVAIAPRDARAAHGRLPPREQPAAVHRVLVLPLPRAVPLRLRGLGDLHGLRHAHDATTSPGSGSCATSATPSRWSSTSTCPRRR